MLAVVRLIKFSRMIPPTSIKEMKYDIFAADKSKNICSGKSSATKFI